MVRFERGKGPVVLCFSAGPAPAGAAATIALEPLSIEAAYFAAGTGGDRLDVAAAARVFADRPLPLSDTALEPLVEHMRYNRQPVSDFYTEKESPRTRMHLFVDVAEGLASVRALQAVLEVLLPYEVPLGIHLFLGGPEKTAYQSFTPIMDLIGEKVAVMSMSGADFALGAATDWDKVLEAYRAVVVLFEGETHHTFDRALADNYDSERNDPGFLPARVGDFGGIRGDLRMEFPVPPGEPPWQWRSDDFGMIVSSRGDHMERMVRILTRSGLPDDVAKMVTMGGRPVVTFDTSTLLSLVPMRGIGLRSLLDTRAKSSLLEIAAAAGKRCARVLDPPHVALGTFSFDGDRDLAADTTIKASPEAAVAAAASEVESAELVVVSVASTDLEPLRAAVAARGGALLVVAGGQLSLFGEGLDVAHEAGAYRDLFATTLDLMAVEHPATSARSLVKP